MLGFFINTGKCSQKTQAGQLGHQTVVVGKKGKQEGKAHFSISVPLVIRDDPSNAAQWKDGSPKTLPKAVEQGTQNYQLYITITDAHQEVTVAKRRAWSPEPCHTHHRSSVWPSRQFQPGTRASGW